MAINQFQPDPWRRVNKQCPCPKCNHIEWCLISQHSVMCMRVPGGKPYKMSDGSIGYIYPVGSDPVRLPPKPSRAPSINARALIDEWAADTRAEWISEQATKLGVSEMALRDLSVCYSPTEKASAWPMRDGYGNVVGIRIRSDSGAKWAVRGSHQGIFYPPLCTQRTVCVCEGPTDTAAALTIGLYAVGRPSCAGGMDGIVQLIRRLKICRAIVVSDNDDPGLRGAEMLGRHLGIPYCTLVLPCKDMRAFVMAGGTATMLQNLINDTVWTDE